VRVLGGRRVLDGVDLTASPGQRIGLVGENGSGKTTLLRVLAGRDEPDGGHVTRPADLGLLHQEPPFTPSATVRDVMADAVAPARRLLDRLDRLAARMSLTPDDAAVRTAYAESLELAERLEAWDAERRAELVRQGLGLGGIPDDRRTGELSGGERSRLALTALLARRPGALLLDEPTNHLDDDALAFLEDHLRGLPGVVVAASHDRVFLDAVCTHIVDLDPVFRPGESGGAVRYTGTYSDHRRARIAERARWEQAYGEYLDDVAAQRHAVAVTARRVAPGRAMRDRNKPAYDRHGGRVLASVSSRVRNARQRLDDLLATPVPQPPRPLRFRAAVGAPETLPPTPEEAPAAEADESGSVLVGGDGRGVLLVAAPALVPGRLAVSRVAVRNRERLLVTGANGAGKSTLLEFLATSAMRRPGTRVALLAQEDAFPRPDRTARQIAGPAVIELGLLSPADAGRPLGALSVGQRRRVALALAIVTAPHVLLLDEPTNHLSLTLVEELEEALAVAPAAVVVASHDRWLRRRWTGRTLHLRAGRVDYPDA
jgi:macrolide transport system ATP-binding/permease protein